MKNKKTAYVLVPAVLLIWGLIGWKIYLSMHRNDPSLLSVTGQQVPVQHVTQFPDSVHLLLNYRDPFLGRIYDTKISVKRNAAPFLKKDTVDKSWPVITYNGLVKRSGQPGSLGFLSIDGATRFIHSGDDAGTVKVGRLWKDSVEVFYNKEKKVVKKALR